MSTLLILREGIARVRVGLLCHTELGGTGLATETST